MPVVLPDGHDSAGYSASVVEMVLMTTTYNFFVRMMIAAANSRKLQKNLAASAFDTNLNCTVDPPTLCIICLPGLPGMPARSCSVMHSRLKPELLSVLIADVALCTASARTRRRA